MSEVRPYARVELIPGKLEVSVFHHVIQTGSSRLPCWTYVTKGLRGQQQKEIVMTLLQGSDLEQVPLQDPLHFFVSLYVVASHGRRVDAGDVSEFDPEQSLLGRPAVLYMPAQSLEGVEVPEPSLAAILLVKEDLEAAKRFGPMRMVNRLADAHAFYPFPPWSDLGRLGLSFAVTLETSLLSQLPICGHAMARVVGGGDGLVLRVDPRAASDLSDQMRVIEATDPVVIWTGPDSGSVKVMVWNPDDGIGSSELPTPYEESEGIEGCFVAIFPGQEANLWRRMEDGFQVLLQQETWNELRPAILSGRPTRVEFADGTHLDLKWVREDHSKLRRAANCGSESMAHETSNIFQETPTSGIDGAPLESSVAWQRHESSFSPEDIPSEGLVDLQHIVLLTPEDEISDRLESKELGNFTRAVHQVVTDLFRELAADRPQELVVETRIQPGGTVGARLHSYPGLPRTLLDHLRLELMAMKGPSISDGSIAFEAHFLVWADSMMLN